MATTYEKIQQAFELARQLTEMLWMTDGGIDPQYLSVDQLVDLVIEQFGVDIDIKTVDLEAQAVYGFIERYEGGKKACIYIVKNIPIRWKRLVGVKEVCHVVVDDQDDWNADGLDTLQRMTTFALDLDALENRALRSETIAEMAAIELLYPHENRQGDLQAVKDGDTDYETLAARYRIPELIVQRVLSPGYLDLCDRYWKRVHDAHQDVVLRGKLGVIEGGKAG